MVLRVESASERGVYAASAQIGPAAGAFFNLCRSRTLKRRKRRAPSWLPVVRVEPDQTLRRLSDRGDLSGTGMPCFSHRPVSGWRMW